MKINRMQPKASKIKMLRTLRLIQSGRFIRFPALKTETDYCCRYLVDVRTTYTNPLLYKYASCCRKQYHQLVLFEIHALVIQYPWKAFSRKYPTEYHYKQKIFYTSTDTYIV